MEEKEIDYIELVDEEGKTHRLHVYFTYHSEGFNKNYVFLSEGEDIPSLLVASYDEEGNLHDVETDEEYDELDAVLKDYQESLNN